MFNRSTLLIVIGAMVIAFAPLPALASDHGSGDINPLAPSAWKLDLALWTTVVFVCLMAILVKFAWKPLAQGLDKREQGIADKIAQAEAANEQAKQILAQHEQKLAAATDEVRAIIEQGRRDAEKLGHDLIDKAKQEAKAEQQRALTQIENATGDALQHIASQSANLAVELAGKIVGSKLNPADHNRLIQKAVGDFVSNQAGPGKVSNN